MSVSKSGVPRMLTGGAAQNPPDLNCRPYRSHHLLWVLLKLNPVCSFNSYFTPATHLPPYPLIFRLSSFVLPCVHRGEKLFREWRNRFLPLVLNCLVRPLCSCIVIDFSFIYQFKNKEKRNLGGPDCILYCCMRAVPVSVNCFAPNIYMMCE